MTYESGNYSDWENKLDFSIIPAIVPKANQASIRAKAAKRSNRYFKEVYVIKRKEKELLWGLYSHSRPWIYSSKWKIDNPRLATAVEKELFQYLMKYCTAEKIRYLQIRTEEYIRERQRDLWPKEPDLFVIDNKERPAFIEVKGSDEHIAEKQLNGLAFIKKYMGFPVSIIRLCDNEQGLSSNVHLEKRLEQDRDRFMAAYLDLPD